MKTSTRRPLAYAVIWRMENLILVDSFTIAQSTLEIKNYPFNDLKETNYDESLRYNFTSMSIYVQYSPENLKGSEKEFLRNLMNNIFAFSLRPMGKTFPRIHLDMPEELLSILKELHKLNPYINNINIPLWNLYCTHTFVIFYDILLTKNNSEDEKPTESKRKPEQRVIFNFLTQFSVSHINAKMFANYEKNHNQLKKARKESESNTSVCGDTLIVIAGFYADVVNGARGVGSRGANTYYGSGTSLRPSSSKSGSVNWKSSLSPDSQHDQSHNDQVLLPLDKPYNFTLCKREYRDSSNVTSFFIVPTLNTWTVIAIVGGSLLGTGVILFICYFICRNQQKIRKFNIGGLIILESRDRHNVRRNFTQVANISELQNSITFFLVEIFSKTKLFCAALVQEAENCLNQEEEYPTVLCSYGPCHSPCGVSTKNSCQLSWSTCFENESTRLLNKLISTYISLTRFQNMYSSSAGSCSLLILHMDYDMDLFYPALVSTLGQKSLPYSIDLLGMNSQSGNPGLNDSSTNLFTILWLLRLRINFNYNQMVKWALSFALTGEVSQHVLAMSNNRQHAIQTYHKEEAEGRIKVDNADRLSLRNTLEVCINPLDDTTHPGGVLMNIVTGQTAHPDVNADNAVSLGQRAMRNFKAGWPGSFYDPLGKLVVAMDVKKKHVLVGKERVYDQELIYPRVIGLLASSREINSDDVLAYELAAYPPSMFNPGGDMKITKSKSTLKLKLQVTISDRNCPIPDTVIYDVSALLWVLTWPSDKLHV
ncbi:hypothetical protein GQR58_017266 [Nymphon striatum]|nr:hypothetical protein GQR58_017266 [Nymphon striatum]